ncbi:DMT family transporter [Sabulicella rubraurantiaca]|uniref:DMT family transporter n=1 Tax=Sabulicella rubraurantiaca TaxID=2811429 RepID=UPI001A95F635|nr:multidrug efflux SMR transporter [Sabulicella rubraurantiaca]
MAWIWLVLAGLLEILWAFSMKRSEGFTRLFDTGVMLVAMAASFVLLAIAMRTLQLGTAYAVWTGIGAAGAFLLGILVLGEAATPGRIAGAALILAGIVVLKLSSSEG